MKRSNLNHLTDDLMARLRIASVALAGAFLLSACGSTSTLQGSHGAAITATRKFSKVTVQDFKVAVLKHADEAASTRGSFPDLIAGEIKKTGRFSSVSRNAKPDARTLVIDGVVTKYDKGSASKRLWIGMGFGMALLEANVEFLDSKGAKIGNIKVDKNSWPLGGAIAAGQNPQGFMNGAADKIAEEAGKLAR